VPPFSPSIRQPSIGVSVENKRMQRAAAVGVADPLRQWHAEAVHVRNLAAQRHLQPEQRAGLQREVDAAD
jgi:hypothetical protein